MTREDAEKYLMKGLDCGQTVLTVMAEELELSEETAQKIASGFGGGMYTGATCGAVVGAIMALGMKYGFSLPINQEEKDLAREKTLEFKRRFANLHGTCCCRELLGVDVSTPEGMETIKRENLLAKKCPQFVADAITILEDMFDED